MPSKTVSSFVPTWVLGSQLFFWKSSIGQLASACGSAASPGGMSTRTRLMAPSGSSPSRPVVWLSSNAVIP